LPLEQSSAEALASGENAHKSHVEKRGTMDDRLTEILAWLFVKSDEEIVAEAEVHALYSMFHGEDPRPERAGNDSRETL